MQLTGAIAKQFRGVFFGGNWTDVNLKDTLQGLNWQQANTKIHSFNTIALMVFHIQYYVSGVLKVLRGGPLELSDRFSFSMPPIHSEEDWQQLRTRTLAEAEEFAQQIAQLPESKLWEVFSEEKYGTYYSNLTGIIEHTHYHLGQIMIIKKLLLGK